MFRNIAGVAGAAIMAMALSASAGQEERRAGMKAIGAAAKAAGKGQDAAANAQKIIDCAKAIPVLFEDQEITGDSEAKPIIWSQWDDFSAKAKDLEMAAMAVLVAANNGGDVGAAVKGMFPTCGGCHKVYRVKN